jgi:hypothetical protein
MSYYVGVILPNIPNTTLNKVLTESNINWFSRETNKSFEQVFGNDFIFLSGIYSIENNGGINTYDICKEIEVKKKAIEEKGDFSEILYKSIYQSDEICISMGKNVNEAKISIREQADELKEKFLNDYYPLIELHEKNAERWVNILHTYLDKYGFEKIGIVMYWRSNSIDDVDFLSFSNKFFKLNGIEKTTVMKFKPEIIYFISI